MDIPDIIKPLLRQYVGSTVIPRYDSFELGHQRDHVEYVTAQGGYLKPSCTVLSDSGGLDSTECAGRNLSWNL